MRKPELLALSKLSILNSGRWSKIELWAGESVQKKTIIAILTIFVIVMAGIWLTYSQRGDVNMVITPEQAIELIQKNKNNPNFVILDVRTPEEYQGGGITGAVNIDSYAADFKNSLNRLDKNKKYLVYCRTGHRSAAAAAAMKTLKFKEVYDLAGGVVAWSQKGYPLVKP
jgi:rhodanese-related sulfurtransferase